MQVLSTVLLFICVASLVQGLTLVIKKNRKYNDPPFCFAYIREYSESEVTTACSGYQYDCFDAQGAQLGATVKFNLKDCTSMSAFRVFSDADFQARLVKAAEEEH